MVRSYQLLLASLLLAFQVTAQTTARVQIIHNAPSPTVDIYAGTTKLLDDFAFRTATPFIDVPAGVDITLGIAPANSTSSTQSIATFPARFAAGSTNVVMAVGVAGGTPALRLIVFDQARERANTPNNVAIAFFHGSPDAPAVDILADNTPLIRNAMYGSAQGYLDVPATTYNLSVTPANTPATVVARYQADLSFWAGRSAVIFASGFLNGNEPRFEPWVALSNGATFPLRTVQAPAPPTLPANTARVQIIHNAPSPTVDIYAGTTKLLDDFVFRTATPYINVPAGTTLQIGVAPGTSQSSAEAIATFPVQFEANRRYVVVATGIVGGNPGFTLRVFDMGREMATNSENVDILFFHGAPDAPAVDVLAGTTPVIRNASYGNFQGYLEVPANNPLRLSVTPAGANNQVVGTYNADLSFWKGRTAVIFASGFLTQGRTPAFAPWVALSNGGTFPLPVATPLRPEDGVEERSVNQPIDAAMRLYPNPVTAGTFNVAFALEQPADLHGTLVNMLGQVVKQYPLGGYGAGEHTLSFQTDGLPKGNYFLTVRTQVGMQTLPLIIAE